MIGEELLQYGFNRGCIGLAIAATVLSIILPEPIMFQSLLYWISHCGVFEVDDEVIVLLFQSLLYWISHCGQNRLAEVG